MFEFNFAFENGKIVLIINPIEKHFQILESFDVRMVWGNHFESLDLAKKVCNSFDFDRLVIIE